ncbi:hypothetical protein Avbf_00385 [Armadillidium vulgare]|nr:hypothetical protein Avbf_00385 [Armadillidium vulgare]
MKLWGITLCLLIVAYTCGGEEGKESGADRKKKLLIAKYRTKTHVSLTTITSTAVLTCQLAPANSATDELNPSSVTDLADLGNNDEKLVTERKRQTEMENSRLFSGRRSLHNIPLQQQVSTAL